MSEQPDDTGIEPDAHLRQLYTGTAAAYVALWLQLEAAERDLLTAWFTISRLERTTRLRQIGQLAQRVTAAGPSLAGRAAQDIADAWHMGQLTQANLIGNGGQASADALARLQELVADSTSSLLDATRFVSTSAKTFIRTMSAEHIKATLAAGQNPDVAARKLIAALEGQGITSVVYRNGARIGLDTYAEMVTRTATATAYQFGGMAYIRAMQVEWVEVLDGPKCGWTAHDDPDLADGTVRSIDVAEQYPISHPSCVRTTFARPDILSAGDAQQAQPSTTAEQRADQAIVSARRELAVAQRAAAKTVAAQVIRRANGILSDSTNRVRSPAYARALARRQVTAGRRTQRSA